MIEKIRIRGYRKFRDLTFRPNKKLNIFVGDNETGKSTILEAVGLALTGKINGRPVLEELSPYWFNRDVVTDFFAARANGKPVALPEILIEVYLEDLDAFQRLHGANNSEPVTTACAGICLRIMPDPDSASEIENHVSSGTALIPVEYYKIDWRSFGDAVLQGKPKDVTVSIIDSRTVRSSSGIDYHLRQMLSEHLTVEEKAAISLAFRSTKEQMTATHLSAINQKMGTLKGAIGDEPVTLAMDQSAKSSWDQSVIPHVSEVPFGMAGQGQQAAVKISLAMGRSSTSSRLVMVEEPENHLSFTTLNVLLNRLEDLAGPNQQLFITTHSSFVLNRLGVDALQLVGENGVRKLEDVTPETVKYFRKLPGHDTLRMVLANRFVLVEGPSDEIVFERFYFDKYGVRPLDHGIDVVSMRSLSVMRGLELAKLLGKKCAAVRDLDDRTEADIRSDLTGFLDTKRKLFVGESTGGPTLEPQIVRANTEETVYELLALRAGTDLKKWMSQNKTEAAIRISDSTTKLTPPSYLLAAIEFIHSAE